jgi:hypothetical protein
MRHEGFFEKEQGVANASYAFQQIDLNFAHFTSLCLLPIRMTPRCHATRPALTVFAESVTG